MFYYISGKLAYLDSNCAVIDAGGVGYKMTITHNTHSQMPPHLTVSEPPIVKLYSYMAVREDGVELFGFMSEEELSAFKMLITVSGVGPKAAVSILSHLTPAKLAVAVCTEDKKSISQANGIGPKTAARIILELKDKLKGQSLGDTDDEQTAIITESNAASSKLSDAQDALAVLGYSRNEALSVLKTIDTTTLELDDIIRLALKKLMR
ncbi:MAG: Holliday junction branch migration protein RuvA [Ruminococcaceae bacterium]|nr:Holliday junction branch migration protein RuvA [Oscillospiraceae bacterium]